MVLAVDTIGHFPITSKVNRLALTAICLHTSYVFAIPMKVLKYSFLTHFIHKVIQKVENVPISLERTPTKFLYNSNVEWDELLQLTCYCYNILPNSNSTESPFFFMLRYNPAEGHLTHLNSNNRYYAINEGTIILEEPSKLW